MRWTGGIGLLTCALALAACGGSSSSASGWKDLKSVTVTVQRPGLPPPYGLPKTTTFTSKRELATVTAALNAHHIAKAAATSTGNGCAGGTKISIVIDQGGSAPTSLSAYSCAGTVTGDIAGDLTGFLTVIGISPTG